MFDSSFHLDTVERAVCTQGITHPPSFRITSRILVVMYLTCKHFTTDPFGTYNWAKKYKKKKIALTLPCNLQSFVCCNGTISYVLLAVCSIFIKLSSG